MQLQSPTFAINSTQLMGKGRVGDSLDKYSQTSFPTCLHKCSPGKFKARNEVGLQKIKINQRLRQTLTHRRLGEETPETPP